MKVFISYSRIDAKETANVIHEYLTKYGHHEVFIDTSNIPYGDNWDEVIQKEISNCDIFIIIITPSALYRPEVEKEVELAKKLKKKIIPCIAKDYVEEDEIKWELNRYQGFFYDRDAKLAMDLHMMIKRDTKIKKTSEIKAEIKTDIQHSPFIEKQNLAESTLQNEKNSAMDGLSKPSVLHPTDKNSNENFQEILKPTTDAKADTPIPIKPNIDEIKSNKKFLQIYLERAKSFEKTKQYQKALSEHEKVLKIDHDNLEALFSKVLILYRMEKFDESLEAIERVIDLQPEHPDIYYYKGFILEKMERHNEALEALEASILINKDIKSLSTKANILLKLERFKEALETFDEILRLDSSNVGALNSKANVLHEQQRYDEALQNYDKVLAIEPAHVLALNNKAIILKKLQRYDEALQNYDKALAIDPDNVQALTYKGIILQSKSLFSEALECFDKALRIDPKNTIAQENNNILHRYLHDILTHRINRDEKDLKSQRRGIFGFRKSFSKVPLTIEIPPTVVGIYPIDGQTEVSINSNVVASFSKQMNSSTINSSTFTLKKSGETDTIEGEITLFPDGKSATFNPSENLEPAAKYIVTITKEVKDVAGNAMANDKQWSFETMEVFVVPHSSS